MADQLSEDQVTDLKKAFDAFDKDGNGTVTTDELGNLMREVGQDCNEEDVNSFIEQMGGEDGRVGWEQYLNFMGKIMNPQ